MSEGRAMAMEDGGDDHGAFMEKFILPPPPSSDQQQQLPLHGLTFAIKDIFDVAGRVTGFGTPDWARTHAPAAATAPAVLAAVAAGATGVGKAVMDEMAYSINGENAHYGTPTNPCAPGRVPGGSSSGSAVAVAASLADFALGTDTGGSVRVPAAYCGIFGLRPSHGVVSVESVVPMAQMFDTVGWFARDLPTLSRVTDVMLPPVPAATDVDAEIRRRPSRVIIPADCFQVLGSVDDHTYEILNASAAKIFGSDAVVDNGNLGDFVSSNVPSIGKFMTDLSAVEASSSCVPALSAISRVMRVLQRSEFKANHAEWVNTVKPNLGPGIRERVLEAIASEDDSAMDDLHAVRTEFKCALAALLKFCCAGMNLHSVGGWNPGNPYNPRRATEATDGRSTAGGLPGEGLLPVVHRRPVGVLPGQHPVGHPLRCPGVSLAARAPRRRPFPRRRGPGAPRGAPRRGRRSLGFFGLA
ncbi:hypothetical protein ACQJBY_040720 [Aegilops geniculata]